MSFVRELITMISSIFVGWRRWWLHDLRFSRRCFAKVISCNFTSWQVVLLVKRISKPFRLSKLQRLPYKTHNFNFPRCCPRLLKPTAKICKLQARLDFTDIVNLIIFKFWFLIFDFKMTAVIWLVFYFPTFRSGHPTLICQNRDFFIDEKSSEDSDCKQVQSL